MGARKRLVELGAVGLLAFLWIHPTTAASELGHCGTADPNISIAYCNAVIESSNAPFTLAMAYSNRGLAYAQKGQYSNALADYAQAIKYDPDFPLAYNNRCYVLGQLMKLEEALADCQKAVTLSPHTPHILDSRGYVYLRMGKYSEAIRDYDEALRISPNKVFSLYGRGVAELKSGNAAAAAKDLAAAKTIDPDIAKKMAIADVNVDVAASGP